MPMTGEAFLNLERIRPIKLKARSLASSSTASSSGFGWSSNHRYNIGINIIVIMVAVISPEITTMASGFCTSEPRPVAARNGASPSTVVAAVMSTGRKRCSQPFLTAAAAFRP